MSQSEITLQSQVDLTTLEIQKKENKKKKAYAPLLTLQPLPVSLLPGATDIPATATY